jgi:hypothetical protein
MVVIKMTRNNSCVNNKFLSAITTEYPHKTIQLMSVRK